MNFKPTLTLVDASNLAGSYEVGDGYGLGVVAANTVSGINKMVTEQVNSGDILVCYSQSELNCTDCKGNDICPISMFRRR